MQKTSSTPRLLIIPVSDLGDDAAKVRPTSQTSWWSTMSALSACSCSDNVLLGDAAAELPVDLGTMEYPVVGCEMSAVRYDTGTRPKHRNISSSFAGAAGSKALGDNDMLCSLRSGRRNALYLPCPAPLSREVEDWSTRPATCWLTDAQNMLVFNCVPAGEHHAVSVPVAAIQLVCPASVYMPVYQPKCNMLDSEVERALALTYLVEGETWLVCVLEENHRTKDALIDILRMLQLAGDLDGGPVP
eukprot:NODE_1644_length_1095_cov_612.140385.p1 GENE.NODE_1644_length_1095_cov_612.140385~~NODE_1644_length_1095_cov_612.140385.p1  ORF type:complete len:245 (-),score=45.73 NODE_1644_length_1095_cov_612.140385:165-899(-)